MTEDNSMARYKAWMDDRGVICFGRRGVLAPRGTIVIAGHDDPVKLRKVVQAMAEKAYDGHHYLVPGAAGLKDGLARAEKAIEFAKAVRTKFSGGHRPNPFNACRGVV